MSTHHSANTYVDKNGVVKKKPSSHIAKEMLSALENQYGSRFSIVREVTIVDPEESALSMAYYYQTYPEYYAKAMLKRGLDLSSLPDTSNFYPGRVPTVRRIDALMVGAMDTYGEYPRTAVEIKTSRADFRKDTDAKRKAWFSVTHRFVYLVPDGMISADEVPQGCGLWYWKQSETGRVSIDVIKRAEVRHNVQELDQGVIAYLLGRVSRAEAKLRSVGLK